MPEESYIFQRDKHKVVACSYNKHYKYSLNESVLDIVTGETAYWVGFIMADGCISYNRRWPNSMPRLRINLKTSDIDHLRKLKTFLEYGGTIALRDNNRYCSLEISSSRLVSALEQYGVRERKSHTASVIGLNHNRHFWRGLIDGDGTLYLSKSRYPQLCLCGSETILTQFVDYVKETFPTIQKIAIRNRASIKQLAIAGRNAVLLVSHFYKNSPVVLERKWRIAQTIMSLETNSAA